MTRTPLTLTVATLLPAAGPALADTIHVNGGCGDDQWTGASPVCSAPDGPKATIPAALAAAADGDEVVVAPGVYPGLINFAGKAVHLRSSDGPGVTILDGEHAHQIARCMTGEGPGTILEGFTLRFGLAGVGGAMQINDASPTILDCVFSENEADVGSAVRCDGNASHTPTFRGCTFFGNVVHAGGGLANFGAEIRVILCDFIANDGGAVSALALGGGAAHPQVINCRFFENTNLYLGATDNTSDSLWVNCAFSRNTSNTPVPTTMVFGWSPTFVHCTFTGDNGRGLSEKGGSGTIRNSIVWGNDGGSLSGDIDAQSCDVAGGWPGPANIDADPLFVRPGTDDLRLAIGSPCLDAANASLLPPDVADLDGDGDVTEPTPVDLAGNPRVIDGQPDMGAYEGPGEPLDPAAGTANLDEGDTAALVPTGADFNPVTTPAALITNQTTSNNAAATVVQHDSDTHPGAGGYSELAATLELETSLPDGGYRAAQFIPFDAQSLAGGAPEHVNVTWYDPDAGSWALAVSHNMKVSPGHQGPIGDRIVSTTGGPPGTTLDAGDHGVWWDAAQQRGFAWANVDRPGEYAIGAAVCPADCHQTPDGVVNARDLLALLGAWAFGEAGPCDLDFDALVTETDLLMLLGEWGSCAPPTPVSPAGHSLQDLVAEVTGRTPDRPLDVDGDGAVTNADYHAVLRAWGPCDGCPADLDGDGVVGLPDAAYLLAPTAATAE